MIQLNNVTKIYNGIPVIKDFTARIDNGEMVFITGPTGSGKSTLLRLIFCSESPDAGQILYQDEDLSQVHRSRIPVIRRTMGFVFQDARLLSHKTVFDNIVLILKATGFPRNETEFRVRETLKLVGMEDKIYAVSATLSGGEQQKVAVARAIVNDPLLLLGDEPTGNLDSDNTMEILRIFEKINRTGTTVIMATHNQEIVKRMGKRVIALKE